MTKPFRFTDIITKSLLLAGKRRGGTDGENLVSSDAFIKGAQAAREPLQTGACVTATGIWTTLFPKETEVSGELLRVMNVFHCTGCMPGPRNPGAPRIF